MDSGKINDAMFEAIFRQAVIENHKQELDEIPPEEELAKIYTFSERHNERMRKLFAADERKEQLERLYKGGRRAAAVVLITTGILFAALMTIPSVQAAVTEVLVEWYEQFTKFTARQSEPVEAKEWSPSYLPDGFAVLDTFVTFDMTYIRYSNSDGKTIDFTYSPIDNSSFSVNNERIEYIQVVEKGVTYYVFASAAINVDSAVIWEIEGYRLKLSSIAPDEELLKIAFSVE